MIINYDLSSFTQLSADGLIVFSSAAFSTHPAVMMSGSCGVLGAILTVMGSKNMRSFCVRMV